MFKEVVHEVKILRYTNNDSLILTASFFPALLQYMFQRSLSPSSAWLKLVGSSTGFQMSLFNGFMYFEINFFHQIYRIEVENYFFMKIFSQIVNSKGFSFWFNNLASFSTICCVIQKWCATADFSVFLYFTLQKCSFNLVSRFSFLFPM